MGKIKDMDWYGIVRHLTIGVDLLYFMILIMNYLGGLSSGWWMVDGGWSVGSLMFYFVVVVNVLFFALKIKKIPEEDREKSSLVYYFSHFFLLSLVIIVLNQFLENEFVADNLGYISALSVAFGFLTFYASRDRVEKEIEDERDLEERVEENRFLEFGDKFPRLDRVWGLGRIFRWGYKEGWWYSIGLMGAIFSGILLRMWRLDFFDMSFVDEIFSFTAGRMILEKGTPLYDSGLFYGRSEIYHYLLAFSMKLFGVNEFGGRIINVFFSIGIIILIYVLLRKVNKKIAIFSSLLFAFSNVAINMSIIVRMYEFFLFLFLFSIYSFYKSFEYKNSNWGKVNFFGLDFNIIWAIIFIFSFLICFDTHEETIVLFFGLFFYYFILNIKTGFKLKNNIFVIMIPSLLFLGVLIKFGRIDTFRFLVSDAVTLSWMDKTVDGAFLYNFLERAINFFRIGFILILSSFFAIKNKKMLYFDSLFLGIFIYLSLTPLREPRYFYLLFPIFFICLGLIANYFYKSFKNLGNMKKSILFLFVGILLFNMFSGYWEVKNMDNYDTIISGKFNIENVYEYLQQEKIDNGGLKVLSSKHLGIELAGYGFLSDYLLIPPLSDHADREYNPYFKILQVKNNNYREIETLINEEKVNYLVLTRDDYKKLYNLMIDKSNRVIMLDDKTGRVIVLKIK